MPCVCQTLPPAASVFFIIQHAEPWGGHFTCTEHPNAQTGNLRLTEHKWKFPTWPQDVVSGRSLGTLDELALWPKRHKWTSCAKAEAPSPKRSPHAYVNISKPAKQMEIGDTPRPTVFRRGSWKEWPQTERLNLKHLLEPLLPNQCDFLNGC